MSERKSMTTSEIQSELCEVADALQTWRAIAANATERRPGNEKLIYTPGEVCELSIMLLETICGKLNTCIEALDTIREPSPEPIAPAVPIPAKPPAKPKKNYVPMQKYVPINQDNRTEVK